MIIMITCIKCKYSWKPRVKEPKECPLCKSRCYSKKDDTRKKVRLLCTKCKHEWVPKSKDVKYCPKCKSKYIAGVTEE